MLFVVNARLAKMLIFENVFDEIKMKIFDNKFFKLCENVFVDVIETFVSIDEREFL